VNRGVSLKILFGWLGTRKASKSQKVGETFDTPLLLDTVSGTVNLKTGQLGPHHRQDYLTKIIPLPFDEDATCPGFHRFLEQTFPSCFMRDCMQKLIGYFLTGSTGLQQWWIFYGPTAAGKSTLINIVHGLLGP
jgi:putative DNA primase/helicase